MLHYFDRSSWGRFSDDNVNFCLKTTSTGVDKILEQRIIDGFQVVTEQHQQKYDMNSIAFCIISPLFKNWNPTHLAKNYNKEKKWMGPKWTFPTKNNFFKNHKYKLFKLYDPSLWMGFDCLKATQPLQGGSLLFTTRSQGGLRTHLIDLERRKGWLNLETTH